MKTIGLLLGLLIGSVASLAAQGVFLGPGDTISFGFDRVDGCQPTKAASGSYVFVGFGSDNLGPGETLRVEMFENAPSDPVLAAETYTPSTPVTGVALYGPRSWLDLQGVIRVTMLNGSVDVTGGYFIVSPDSFTYCPATVLVPEPTTLQLGAIGCAFAIIILIRRRMTNAREEDQKTTRLS